MTVPNGSRFGEVGAAGGVPSTGWRDHFASRAVPRIDLPEGPLVLVAPHPDDEVLGLGATLAARAPGDTVICVSDGSASHPGIVDPAEMRGRRRAECAAGARDLGVDVVYLDLPDGALTADAVDAALHPALDAANPATVAVTWSGDGHPDHHQCAESVWRWRARLRHAPLIVEYPVWMWHWAGIDDPAVPWHRLRSLPVPLAAEAAKRQALFRHASQLESIGGADPILPPQVVDRFFLGCEWVLL